MFVWNCILSLVFQDSRCYMFCLAQSRQEDAAKCKTSHACLPASPSLHFQTNHSMTALPAWVLSHAKKKPKNNNGSQCNPVDVLKLWQASLQLEVVQNQKLPLCHLLSQLQILCCACYKTSTLMVNWSLGSDQDYLNIVVTLKVI